MNQRPRILIIENLAVESARRSLYRAIAQQGDFEVHLLVPERWMEQVGPIECEEESDDLITVHRTGYLFAFRQHRVIYTGIYRALRRLRPHVFLMEMEPENYATAEALVLKRFVSPSTKLGLVSYRNLDNRQIGFPYKFEFTHRFCDSLAARWKVDLCIVRPKNLEHLLAPYARRVRHVPFSVDCTVFRRFDAHAEVGTPRPLVLGYVGRIIEQKGIHVVIEALASLSENVEFRIVGKGPFKEKLQVRSRELGVADRILFESPVRYADVPALLNTIDILVLPSLETKFWIEQFGRVLIEAMACEVPIVASDSGEIPNVLGGCGLLFPVGDKAKLVEQLMTLIEDRSLREELTRKGRARALAEYDVPVVAAKLANAIRETLER